MTKKDTNKSNWKNIKNLGFVSFFTDVSSEMIFGILPIFIIDELGTSKGVLGLIEGLGESVGYGSRTFSGAISDKLGKRKPLVFLGYSLSTIAKPLFALSTVWSHALSVRVADRIGKGVRSAPRDALLVDSAGAKIGRAFGLHRTLDSAGAIVGPLIAFALIPLVDIRGIFWISLIPAAASLIILLLFVKEKRIQVRTTTILSNFRQVLRGKFLLYMIVVTIFSLGAYNFSFVLVKSSELGLVAAMVPLVYAVINIAHTATGYPAGVLSDRISAEKILLIGFGLFFVTSLIGFSNEGELYLGFVMAGIFGAYLGFTITSQRTIVAKYISPEVRATGFGIYYLMIGISFLIANVIFGVLWDQFGSQFAFTYSLIMSGIAVIAFLIFYFRK